MSLRDGQGILIDCTEIFPRKLVNRLNMRGLLVLRRMIHGNSRCRWGIDLAREILIGVGLSWDSGWWNLMRRRLRYRWVR